VIETAVGCDRLFLAFLCDAYREEVSENRGKEEVRVVLGLHPKIAPIKVGILPLSKKAPLQELGHNIYQELAVEWNIDYDDTQSIGKRYRRQDEIGTPLCVTVDFESLEDQKVTVRHRDTMAQDRVAVDQLFTFISEKLKNF